MAEPASQLPISPAEPIQERPPESFMQVTIRRSRYLVAIVIAVLLFTTLGFWACHLPVGAIGISLSIPEGGGSGILGAFILLLLAALATAIASPITRPDSPHAAMWCVFVGLGGLAIRGGEIQELLLSAQNKKDVPGFYRALAGECFFWLAIVIVADIVSRLVWKKFFSNTLWISRNGVDLGVLTRGKSIGAGLPGITLEKDARRATFIDSAIAFAVTGIAAWLLMPVLLQSQSKGQVLMGAFVCFGVGATVARLFAPFADPIAFWAAVPMTAAVGFLLAGHDIQVDKTKGIMELAGAATQNAPLYPAISPSASGRALPIDLISGGIAGAIMGYYIAVRIHINHILDKARHAEEKAKS